jgi:septal ring factor EnvC (AmiA/AmiB activator)
MREDQTLLNEIDALLQSRARDLALIERTLTDGYARALSLEAERARLEKRLSAVAATLERGDVDEKAKELLQLAKRLEAQDGSLSELREHLSRLRKQYGDATGPKATRGRRGAAR